MLKIMHIGLGIVEMWALKQCGLGFLGYPL